MQVCQNTAGIFCQNGEGLQNQTASSSSTFLQSTTNASPIIKRSKYLSKQSEDQFMTTSTLINAYQRDSMSMESSLSGICLSIGTRRLVKSLRVLWIGTNEYSGQSKHSEFTRLVQHLDIHHIQKLSELFPRFAPFLC